MEYVAYLFLALLILLVMITIHEFGHYLAGKLLGFKINEFSIGFGPKLLGKKNKKSGEVFSIRAIPLGGFCAFEGESEDADGHQPDTIVFEEEKPQTKTGQETKTDLKFNDHAPWKRIIVFVAGGTFNLLSAVIFSFIFIFAVGLEKPPVIENLYHDPITQIEYSQEFEIGDKIISVNGKKLTLMYNLGDALSKVKKGDTVTFLVERDGEIGLVSVEATVQEIKADPDQNIEEDFVGFGFTRTSSRDKRFSTAAKYSVPYTLKMSWLVLSIFGKLITGQVPLNQLSGPVGTIDGIARMSILNWRNILVLLPLIAANLGIFNLLPIPALDGSKIAFASVEWVRKKPLNRKIENTIHAVGLLLLLGFVIMIEVMGAFARCGL